MVPHYGYKPPAVSIIDQDEPAALWTGANWLRGNMPFNVPANHRLIGRPGGPLAGWRYDWQMRAWMEPSPQPAAPAPRPAPSRPMQPATRPQTPMRKEFAQMGDKKSPQTVLEDLMKHPVAPVVGGVLLVASYFTDEPAPPTIPDGLAEPVAKQWQMVYSQNQQRFQRRMDVYRDLGMVLLGYSSARSIVDVLQNHRPAAMLVEKK